MKTTRKPGDLLKMFRAGGKQRNIAMKAANFTVGKVKHTGSFQGKSNALGHGGRAAQLKARGVPGGVIGMMARRVGAAPGGPNYHGKKAHKAPAPEKQNLGLALKHSKKMKGAAIHHHIHVHGHKGALHVHMKGASVSHGTKMIDPTGSGEKLEHMEEGKHEFKHSKRMKKSHKNVSHAGKVIDPTAQGTKLEHEEEGKKEFKKSHKCKGASCKHASHVKGKRAKHSSAAIKGLKEFATEEAKEKKGKKKVRHE